MIERTKWLERRFNSDFPVGLFPYLIERLKGTPARLDEMVASYSADILIERVAGGWSIQEHIGHLIDLEELHDGRLDDFAAGAKELRPADMSNKKTNEADHNRASSRQLLALFRKTRGEFVARFEAIDDPGQTALHPRLKTPMRAVDMAFFVAEHDDHHLAIISEIARRLKR